jgi:hypothetical protein
MAGLDKMQNGEQRSVARGLAEGKVAWGRKFQHGGDQRLLKTLAVTWSGGGGLVRGDATRREMGVAIGGAARVARARPRRAWAAVWLGRENGGLTGGAPATVQGARRVKGYSN